MQFSSSRSASLLGLETLTVLVLAAAPAHAQSLTLNNGDNAVVSGAGTVGTVGGTPVANTTSAYSSGNNFYAVETNGTSTFTLADGGILSAGNYDYGLLAGGSGPVTITGGTLSAGNGGSGLVAAGSGPVNISGGTFSAGQDGIGLLANSSGPVNISGGTFSAGQGGAGLLDNYGTTLNLFSFGDTPFLIDGVAMNNTTLDGSLYYSGKDTISGILANGDTLNTTFVDDGTFNLNVGVPPAAVPEASTPTSLGLLLMLGLGGVLGAKKKTARAALSV